MLAKRNRFHGNVALRWVYAGGQQARGRHMAIRVRHQSDQTSRVAVVVSRKVSKRAVVRNRIRRRIYEIIRTELLAESAGLAIVITAYDEALRTLPQAELREEIEYLLSKARSIHPRQEGHAIVKRRER